MTKDEQIAALRRLVEDEEGSYSDALLSSYLWIAGRKILSVAYPFREDRTAVPPKYQPLQLEIAAYLVSKRGAEGETAHSENGISRTYGDADVPASLLRTVTPHCGVIE